MLESKNFDANGFKRIKLRLRELRWEKKVDDGEISYSPLNSARTRYDTQRPYVEANNAHCIDGVDEWNAKSGCN